jgi:hypothetical protein
LGKRDFVEFKLLDNVKLDFNVAEGVENFLTSYGVDEFVIKPKSYDK